MTDNDRTGFPRYKLKKFTGELDPEVAPITVSAMPYLIGTVSINAGASSYQIAIPKGAEILSCIPDRVFNPVQLIFSYAFWADSTDLNDIWDVIVKNNLGMMSVDTGFEFLTSVSIQFAAPGTPFGITVNGISQTINVPNLTSMQNAGIYHVFVKPPDRNQ